MYQQNLSKHREQQRYKKEQKQKFKQERLKKEKERKEKVKKMKEKKRLEQLQVEKPHIPFDPKPEPALKPAPKPTPKPAPKPTPNFFINIATDLFGFKPKPVVENKNYIEQYRAAEQQNGGNNLLAAETKILAKSPAKADKDPKKDFKESKKYYDKRVVYISSQHFNGSGLLVDLSDILGSGYRRAILTNRHVVNDSNDTDGNTVFQGDFHVSHNFEGKKKAEEAESFVAILKFYGSNKWIDYQKTQPGLDYAVLVPKYHVGHVLDGKYDKINTNEISKIQCHSKVSVCGHSYDFSKRIKKGKLVKAHNKELEVKCRSCGYLCPIFGPNAQVFAISGATTGLNTANNGARTDFVIHTLKDALNDADASYLYDPLSGPGGSGGPIFDADNNPIGIVHSGTTRGSFLNIDHTGNLPFRRWYKCDHPKCNRGVIYALPEETYGISLKTIVEDIKRRYPAGYIKS